MIENSKFDLSSFYKNATSGEKHNVQEVLQYIAGFPTIIVWGASFLGEAIGKFLIENNIHITCYWDARADELKELNGIPVELTFSNSYMPEETLIILAIGNTAIVNNLKEQTNRNNYTNVIWGDKLFMGAICPFVLGDKIDGEICNGRMTCRSMFCSRLHSIVKNNNDSNGVFLQNITFMITSYCSLKCKYCVAYMNSYESSRRRHVPESMGLASWRLWLWTGAGAKGQ